MKNLLIVCCVLTLSLSACQQDPTPGTEGAEVAASTDGPTRVSSTDLPVLGPKAKKGMVSDQTMRVLEVATSGYWYMEAYIKIKDKEAALSNRGRWYKLDIDGTYTNGQWKETTGKGTWTYDPDNLVFHFDADEEKMDSEWKVKMSSDGKVMLWIGTARFNQNNIQTKLGVYQQLLAPEDLPLPNSPNPAYPK